MLKTAPVRPARIAFDAADNTPSAPDYGDVYHARAGALAQARHVFLGGNGLPARWQGRARFTILETGFGLGHNFLATWDAWRQDRRRCERLYYVAIEKHPPTRADLATVHAASPLAALAEALIDAWPLATPNLHRLAFEGGRVQLVLALHDVRDALPQLVATVDACYLDGFAPARNPEMWARRTLAGLARLAAPGATAATWSAAREVRDGLAAAGFAVERARGFDAKRDMTVATFAPRFTARPPAGRPASTRNAGAPEAPVVIVGAGLAGCATAWALAEQGIASLILERGPAPAGGASGQPAALFHGSVNQPDGLHARFNRAAALATAAIAREALAGGTVEGRLEGLLRVQARGDAGVESLRALVEAQGLPAGYVQALDASATSAAAGLRLARAAWLYPGGGWLRPASLADWWRAQAGDAATLRCGVDVARLGASPSGAGWCLHDARGRLVAEASDVVLANAHDALHLLGPLAHAWPLLSTRGQTTLLRGDDVPQLRLPVSGLGYAVPLGGRTLLCGATSDPAGHDDDAPIATTSAHALNLERLRSLLAGEDFDASTLAGVRIEGGHAGLRLAAPDRLPVLGAVPDLAALSSASRRDHARFLPRLPGLHVHLALGSRGLTWAALSARVLAARLAGAPCPVEADLLDATDVARFAARAARQEAARFSARS